MQPHYPGALRLRVVYIPEASASPGSLSEMQNPRPSLSPADSALVFLQNTPVICVHKVGKVLLILVLQLCPPIRLSPQ